MLDRKVAVPALLGDTGDFLIVSGLGGASKDMAALTGDAPNLFGIEGAMGAASMVGLGLALARPDRRVLVVTGDGEMLMNVGSLATIAAARPANLAIVCIDNGRYGETGYQVSHTALGADLAAMARAAGIVEVTTVDTLDDVPSARRLVEHSQGPAFILVRVAPTEGHSIKHELHPAACRLRFKQALST